MTVDSLLAEALRRDRATVLAALAALTALAWGYVLWLSHHMTSMSMPDMSAMPDMAGMAMPDMDMRGMAMPAPAYAPWTPAHLGFIFCMWAVMMLGMMTPSVAPMVLIYIQLARQSASRGQPLASAGWFAGGYLAAWTLFSLFATLAQWALEALALLTPMMATASRQFGGLVLIAAGLYQWSRLKYACLSQCRAPLSFVQRHGGFQSSATGSLRLGLLHGLQCIGCCWALMALLFVGGVMNLLWIAALMIFTLGEKLIPGGRNFSRCAGAAFIVAGFAYLLHGA